MDELELLKKDWRKHEEELPKLSYDEIYRMIWKKSSSIVKWILIISILEFTLPHLLYLLPGASENMEIYEKLGVKRFSTVFFVIGYAVTFYFIFLFYKRYREINVLDNARDLMEKIINTRKTVKYYIIYGLTFLFLTCCILFIGIYLTDDLSSVFPEKSTDELSPEKLKNILLWTVAITSIVLTAFMGGIYFLLYGLLLRKLNRNFKELKRLEV